MIDVMQTAKHRLPDDLPVARIADRRIDCAWSALADRAVRAPAIEILHIFRHSRTQMALIEDEHMVQAFCAQRSHPALGDRICLRRPEWRADLGDPEAPHPLVKERPIAPVTIVDEKAWWLPIPAAAFDDLSACPLRRRMPRRLDA